MQEKKFFLNIVVICLTFGNIEAWIKHFQISKQDPKNPTVPGDGCDASLVENRTSENSDVIERVWVEGALWLEPHNCASLGNGTRDFAIRKNLVRVNPKNSKDFLFCCTYTDFGRSRANAREHFKDDVNKTNYFILENCLTRNLWFRYYDSEDFYKNEKNGPIRDDFGVFNIFDPRSYQHVAAIGWTLKSKINWECTGVLITDKHVVTAASCALKQRKSPDVVRLGVIDLLSNAINKAQDIAIAAIIKHPQYLITSYYHDIAVITLSHTIKKSYYVVPACLQTTDGPLSKHPLKAAVYNPRFGDRLFQTEVEVIDNAICSKKFKENARIQCGLADGQFCAKTESREYHTNKKDCPDNGGGPFQYVLRKRFEGITYKIPVVVAITSSGIGCIGNDISIPGVHTKISGYIDWIVHVIKKLPK